MSALEATRLTVDPIPVAAAPVGLAAADDGTPWVLTTDGEVGFVRPIEDDKAGEELTLDDPAYSLASTGARSVGHDRGRGGAHRPRGPAGARRAGRPRGGQRQRDRRRRRRAVGVRHDRQQPSSAPTRRPRGRSAIRSRSARRCATRSWPARARSGCCARTSTPTPPRSCRSTRRRTEAGPGDPDRHLLEHGGPGGRAKAASGRPAARTTRPAWSGSTPPTRKLDSRSLTLRGRHLGRRRRLTARSGCSTAKG